MERRCVTTSSSTDAKRVIHADTSTNCCPKTSLRNSQCDLLPSLVALQKPTETNLKGEDVAEVRRGKVKGKETAPMIAEAVRLDAMGEKGEKRDVFLSAAPVGMNLMGSTAITRRNIIDHAGSLTSTKLNMLKR